MPAQTKVPWFQILQICVGLLLTIGLALNTWVLTQVVEMKADLAAIKSNRFTSNDGLAVWKEISKVKETVSDGVPPKWLLDRLDRMEESISGRLDKLEDRLAKVEEKQ